MKKTILTILLFMMLLPFVKASSCDLENVTIESITVDNTTGNASEKNHATTTGNNINLDLSLDNVGDSISYKIEVRNDSNEDVEINEDAFNVNTSDYIRYTLDNEESVLIRAKSSKIVILNIEYSNEVPASLMNADGYKEEADLTIAVTGQDTNTNIIEEIINPKTGDVRVIIVAIVLVLSAFAYLIFSKEKPLLMIIIGLFLIPIITFATCEVEFNIKANIEIKKIAEFDKGYIVNKKMNILSNGIDELKGFERSNTLPDNIKTLVEEQLSEAANINVTDEEVNSQVNSIIQELTLLDELTIKEEDNYKDYCFSSGNNEYCSDTRRYNTFNNDIYYFKYQEDNSEEIKYFIYDIDINEGWILSLDEFKEYIKNKIKEDRRNEILVNVFSSEKSDYPIYGWYDNNKIYYYCEMKDVYLNSDSSFMFSYTYNMESHSGVEELNTSKVKYMVGMLADIGQDVDTFELDLSGWDVSNVVNMSMMFDSNIGGSEGAVATDHLYRLNVSGWDTSSVKDMTNMFYHLGALKINTVIEGLQGWDISNLKYMSKMFDGVGMLSTSLSIGDISHWNTSKVKNMSGTFSYYGSFLEIFELDLSGWDVSKVEDFSDMFNGTCERSTTCRINGISNWNIGNAKNLEYMFYYSGGEATTWNVGDLSGWDTSKVENMHSMFSYSGRNVTTWSVGDISSWNVSNVTDMGSMFYSAGQRATTWNIGNLSSWDMSKVNDVSNMFYSAGQYSTNIIDVGTLDIYAKGISYFARTCPNIKAVINLYNKPINYSYAFTGAATNPDASIIVNYSSIVDNINSIINTKSSNSNVTKGELLD